MTERRYTDDETSEILRAAAESPVRSALPVHADGFTLAQLQEIGSEAGIAPEAVARAAKAMEVRAGGVSRTLLGLPVGVERRVALGRKLTDEEWEHLVVELRDVFKARGRMKTEGNLRQWTNGNLYVLLEPTATGHRLRLGSLHGGAAASMRLGILAVTGGVITAIAGAMGADVGTAFLPLLVGGAVMFANGALRVRSWARLRATQMEQLAAQLVLPEDTSQS